MDFYYYPGSPPCRAVLGVGETLGIKFNLKLVDLFQKEQLKPEFLKINPRHTLPTINDNGFILVESRAILQYLANSYSRNDSIYPKGAKQRALVDQMLLFDMGVLNKLMGETYISVLFGRSKLDPEKVKEVNTNLAHLEGYLAESKYSVGDKLTIADFSLIPTLTTLEACGHKFTQFPKITAYMATCKNDMKGYAIWNQKAVDGIKGMWKKATEVAP